MYIPRSGYFTFDSEILDHGIKLYKYVLPQEELLNTTQERYGFPSDNPSGVLNLTPNFDPPVEMFASKPHFLDAAQVYRDNVTGLNPNKSIHDSYMGVEPITGKGWLVMNDSSMWGLSQDGLAEHFNCV